MEPSILCAKIRALLPHFSADVDLHGSGRRQIFCRGRSSVTLTEAGIEKLSKIVREMSGRLEWGSKFTYEQIANRVITTSIPLWESHSNDETQANAARDLMKSLDTYSEVHRVSLPLAGIVAKQPIVLGRVTIREVTSSEIEAKEQSLASRLNRDDESLTMFSGYKSFSGKSCAEFEAIGTSERVVERALEETHRVLDVLRFTRMAIEPPASRDVRVALAWEMFDGIRSVPIFNDAGEIISMSHTRPTIPFVLSEANVNRMRDCGGFVLFDLLSRELNALTEFERLLLDGLHWYADSEFQVQHENQVLSLITCLETFLTFNNAPIANSIAEGVAFLISDEYDGRVKLKAQVRRLYNLRNSVSHGGKTPVSEQDVLSLSKAVWAVLAKLIELRTEVASRADLSSWIEKRRLS